MPQESESSGSLAALNALFISQRPTLLAFVQGLVRDRPAAEEIVQEVWLRLADSHQRNVAVREPERWFRGVAKNLILHHFRSRRTTKVVADSQLLRMVELAELAFDEQPADDIWARRRAKLPQCIAQLPEKSREVLRMKYSEGMRVAEIARKLGRTEDAIMKSLSRIRQLLSQCADQDDTAE